MKNESKFAFTVDAWSGKTRKSYYGVTIHYVDAKWNLNSITLDFRPSNGKHSGDDIANIFYKITKDYNIHKKISDEIDFDCEDQHFRCFAHILNLSVQDMLELMECCEVERYLDEEEDSPNFSYEENEEFEYLSESSNTVPNVIKKNM
ncbi:hypothetical protein TKK_0016701 [Trichogramma kaykai]